MDNSRAMAATVVGAVVGGVAGYLFFTDHGRSVRRQIEPALDDFSRELMSFRATVQKASGRRQRRLEAVERGARRSQRHRRRSIPAAQTSPF